MQSAESHWTSNRKVTGSRSITTGVSDLIAPSDDFKSRLNALIDVFADTSSRRLFVGEIYYMAQTRTVYCI